MILSCEQPEKSYLIASYRDLFFYFIHLYVIINNNVLEKNIFTQIEFKNGFKF